MTSAMHSEREYTDAREIKVDASSDAGTYVTFDLSGESLGVEVQHVREILDRVKVNRLPNASYEIEGVIDIRGESIPIIDMGSKLGLPRLDDGEDTRIIVFELGNRTNRHPVGVFADKVRDVTRISKSQIEYPPNGADSGWNSEYLIGLARHGGLLILILDMQKVFGTGEQVQEFDVDFMS